MRESRLIPAMGWLKTSTFTIQTRSACSHRASLILGMSTALGF
jgi:hypothetical protein